MAVPGPDADHRGYGLVRGGWPGGVEMTRQYLAGELSLLLAELQAVTTNSPCARDVARLRQEAETGRLSALPSVVVRALEVADIACWNSLTSGDSAAFIGQAIVCAELWEFG